MNAMCHKSHNGIILLNEGKNGILKKYNIILRKVLK